MTTAPLDLPARAWLALTLPFRVLFDAHLAARVDAALEGRVPSLPPAPSQGAAKVDARAASATVRDLRPALQLLSILQREGRFLDFVQEDLTGVSDAEVGAAARVVHEGSAKAVRAYVDLAPVRSETEGTVVELPKGYDASRHRVTGRIGAEPPYRGRLVHPGWFARAIHLPELAKEHDASVLSPAEIDVG